MIARIIVPIGLGRGDEGKNEGKTGGNGEWFINTLKKNYWPYTLNLTCVYRVQQERALGLEQTCVSHVWREGLVIGIKKMLTENVGTPSPNA